MKLQKSVLYLILILLAGLVVRLLVSPYYTHGNDMGLWKYWANDISMQGFHNYFEKTWTDYLPFYFYILFILGKISLVFNINNDLLFKMPGILADLGTSLVIYLLLKKYQIKNSLLYTSLFIFNPAIFANSSMWGQVDGLGVFLIILALYFFMNKKVILMGVSLSAALLFKPLYLIALPIFLLGLFKINRNKIPTFIFSLTIFTFLIAAPFAGNILFTPHLIFDRYFASINQYNYASVNAFNFWSALGQNWVSDKLTFFNIPYNIWGLLIFGNLFLMILVNLFLKKFTDQRKTLRILAITITLSFLCIFTFATKVHERHMLTALPFLVLLIGRNAFFNASYFFLSVLYLINLYFGYKYLYEGFIFTNDIVRMISTIVVLTCVGLFFYSIFIWKNLEYEKV